MVASTNKAVEGASDAANAQRTASAVDTIQKQAKADVEVQAEKTANDISKKFGQMLTQVA